MTPKCGFRVAMLLVGALCFYQEHFGRTVLSKWPLWAHLFYSVFCTACRMSRASAKRIVSCRGVALPPCAPTPNPTHGARFQIWAFSDLGSLQTRVVNVLPPGGSPYNHYILNQDISHNGKSAHGAVRRRFPFAVELP